MVGKAKQEGTSTLDNIGPSKVVETMVDAGAVKAKLPVKDLLIRGAMAGAFLGFATTLAFTATIQTGLGIVGALIFPVGFVMVVLLGMELVTGNFALIPAAMFGKRATWSGLISNWSWVIVGHLIGSVFYAALFALAVTQFGTQEGNPMIDQLVSVAEAKTTAYAALGAAGMGTVFVKAVLCNWMVALGAIMAMTSNSTIGKTFAMWLPILIFFAQGFEHSVVNMFVIPAGMLVGADVSVADWWIWNQIPVLVGNLVSGVLLTAGLLYFTYQPRGTNATAGTGGGSTLVEKKEDNPLENVRTR